MVRVFPLVVVLTIAACSKGTPAQASTQSPSTKSKVAVANALTAAGQSPAGQAAAPATPAAKPVPEQLPEVVARVNGEAINKSDLERAVRDIEGRAGGPVPPEQRDRVYRGLLDRLVGYRLLVQEANTRKVAVPDADVDQRMNAIRQQFPNEEEFKKQLDARHLTVEQIRTDARADMAIGKMVDDEIGKKVAPTTEAVKAFYDENPQSFKAPETVKASHILVSVPANADAAAKAKAREKAEGLLKDVKAGKDFAELAKANSDDPGSAQNGGDLGYFQQGQMVGPFNDAAFSLKPGTTSELVETQFGFHIIKVVDKKDAHTVTLDEARPKIQEYLEQQNRQKETEAFVNALRTKGKVEIFI